MILSVIVCIFDFLYSGVEVLCQLYQKLMMFSPTITINHILQKKNAKDTAGINKKFEYYI